MSVILDFRERFNGYRAQSTDPVTGADTAGFK